MAQNPGILGALGLNIDPEMILREQRKKQQAEALGLTTNLGLQGPGAQGAANIGALIGARLASPAGLTDDQSRRVATAQSAEDRMKLWLRTNSEASQYEQGRAYKTFLAEEAFRNGLGDVGSQIMSALDAEAQSRRRQQLELEKLDIEVGEAKEGRGKARLVNEQLSNQNELMRYSLTAGKVVPIWEIGEQDPNASVSAYIDPETMEAIVGNQRVPLGQYTTHAPFVPTASRTGKTGAGTRTPTENMKLREKATAVHEMNLRLLKIADLFKESVQTEGEVRFLGASGKFASFANRFADNALSLAKIFSPGGKIGDLTAEARSLIGLKKVYKLDQSSERARFARDYADELRAVLPESLRSDANLADRYNAIMVDLAYAVARGAEPGARQLSDVDLVNAAAQIGQNLTDPETLRQILLERTNFAHDSLWFSYQQLSPEQRLQIWSADSESAYLARRQQVQEAFQLSFGSAFEPGPGLRTAPGETVRDTAQSIIDSL